MKELFVYLGDIISLAGYLFFFAVFGSISVIAYHFYPLITVTVLTLMVIGWIMDFFKRKKSLKNS